MFVFVVFFSCANSGEKSPKAHSGMALVEQLSAEGAQRELHPLHFGHSSAPDGAPSSSCTGIHPRAGAEQLVAAATSCHHPMPPSLLHHELSEHGVMPLWCPQHAACTVSTYGGLHIRASCILQTHSCRSRAQHHPHLSLCNSTTAAVPSQAIPIHGCDISVSAPCACCVQEAAGQCET